MGGKLASAITAVCYSMRLLATSGTLDSSGLWGMQPAPEDEQDSSSRDEYDDMTAKNRLAKGVLEAGISAKSAEMVNLKKKAERGLRGLVALRRSRAVARARACAPDARDGSDTHHACVPVCMCMCVEM